MALRDAEAMLGWMYDDKVIEFLDKDFASFTLTDCQTFIEVAQNTEENLHLAIVDANDEYLGTVSLKNIHVGSAEFAIVLRREAMGKGYATFAVREILHIGFQKLGLQVVYWNVRRNNTRALHLYDKLNMHRVSIREVQACVERQIVPSGELYWYLAVK